MQVEIIEIGIDLKWSLDDFSFMTKMYTQCYSLLYSHSNIESLRVKFPAPWGDLNIN